jgi:hypothetical protein
MFCVKQKIVPLLKIVPISLYQYGLSDFAADRIKL